MKYLAILITILVLGISAYTQTIKTEAAYKITALDTKIAKVQTLIEQVNNSIKLLSDKYTPGYKEIVAAKAQLAELEGIRLKLEAEKALLATQPLVMKLPNTNVELLKVIALQNENWIARTVGQATRKLKPPWNLGKEGQWRAATCRCQPMNISKSDFESLEKNYGGFGSCAIWDPADPKCTDIIRESIGELDPSVVMVGPNISALTSIHGKVLFLSLLH